MLRSALSMLFVGEPSGPSAAKRIRDPKAGEDGAAGAHLRIRLIFNRCDGELTVERLTMEILSWHAPTVHNLYLDAVQEGRRYYDSRNSRAEKMASLR
jgi:hypothetical protein